MVSLFSAIHNPNTSDQAKWEAEKKLHELEGPQGNTGSDSKDPTHVAAGLKAYVLYSRLHPARRY
jgi:hypothetical protein